MTGRPQTEPDDRVTTSLRLPRDLHERLQAAAKEREVGVNLLANHAIAEFLDRLIPVAELRFTRSGEGDS